MAYKNEIRIGRKIELEHKPTYRMIRTHLRKYKKLPTLKRLASSIAKDHIREHKCYYGHKKYGLIKMEKELKEECKKRRYK